MSKQLPFSSKPVREWSEKEFKQHEVESQRLQKEVSRLRKEFGLPVYYTGNKLFTGRLVVLKKVYLLEQVTRLRRLEEQRLRTDPAEVIRYALKRKLVK